MANVRTDPIRNFKFRVTIDLPGIDSIRNLGFASCSGLSVQNELIPYREGGDNTSPRKMVGQSDHAPISLSRGMFPNQLGLYAMQKHIYLSQWGNGTLGAGQTYRATVLIESFDHPINKDVSPQAPGPVVFTAKIFNAWCGSFAMNDWNAGDNGILIQQITLHHEGFEIIPGSALLTTIM